MNRQRGQRVPAMVGIVGIVTALILGGAAPVTAGGAHSGHYGVHTLIDNGEYAGAICGYNNTGFIDTIKIRRPIIFAFDRTTHLDTQKVGWRFNIEYSIDGSGWSLWHTSNIVAASATEKVNGHFKPRTFHLVNPVKTTYWRATVDLYWFYPDVNHVNGQANHIVGWYQINHQVAPTTWCPEQQPKTIITPPPSNHSGNYGVHTLIDNVEYPGATCAYHNGTHDDYLHQITVRRPIIFAYDRTAGLDSQTVGWKATVQYTDDNVSWHKLAASPISKAHATDQVNAAFGPRSFTIGSPQGHAHFRVMVRLLWYGPGSTHVTGSALHMVGVYRGTGPGVTPFITLDNCSNALG